MTSILQPKSTWVLPNQPVTGPPSELSKVDKIIIHYPGVLGLDLANPVGVLRNTQNYYLNSRGYSIGYNFCIFPSGRYEARGFSIKNAANKGSNPSQNLNATSLSINIMVNGNNPATPSQIVLTQDMVADIFTVLNKQVPLIAHGKVDGTQCPGLGISSQLNNGLFLPKTAQNDPPLKPDEEEMYLLTNLETRSFGGNLWPPKTIIYNLGNDGKLRHIPEIEGLIRGTAALPKQAVSNAYLDALPQ